MFILVFTGSGLCQKSKRILQHFIFFVMESIDRPDADAFQIDSRLPYFFFICTFDEDGCGRFVEYFYFYIFLLKNAPQKKTFRITRDGRMI